MSELKERIDQYRLQRDATAKLGNLATTPHYSGPDTIEDLWATAMPNAPGFTKPMPGASPNTTPAPVVIPPGPVRTVTELSREAKDYREEAHRKVGVDTPIARNPAERAPMADLLANRVRRDAEQAADALIEDGIHMPQDYPGSNYKFWPVPFVAQRYKPGDAPGSHDHEPLVHSKPVTPPTESPIIEEVGGKRVVVGYKQSKLPAFPLRIEPMHNAILKRGGILLREDGQLFAYNANPKPGEPGVSPAPLSVDEIAYSKLNPDGSNIGESIEQWRDMLMTVVTAPEHLFNEK